MLKILFIKDDIRPYDTAASVAVRYAFLCSNIFNIELLAAVHAVIPEYRTVKLDNTLASGLLMEIIDVLCDYRLELTLSLESYKSLMSLVGSGIRIDKLTLVKVIEIFRMLYKEVVGNDVDRSVLCAALCVIDTGTASEVRNAALCRYTCSAKEHDIVGFRN